MNFPTAIMTVFRRYAVFSGRSGRPEFWWFFLFCAVMTVATDALDASLFSPLLANPESGFSISSGPLGVIFTLVWLIPVIGWIVAVVLCAQEGQPNANEYGPPVPQTELSAT